MIQTNDFTKSGFCPDLPASREEKWRLRTAKFGDGYEERVLDGLNALEEKWSVKFSNRSKDYILQIDAFLKAVGANSFEFYERDTEETIEVYCDGWSVEWQNKTARDSLLGTVTVDLRRVFSHASPAGGSNYVLPIATETDLGGIKASTSVKVDPVTGVATVTPASIGASPLNHTHTFDGVVGLQTALDGKADDQEVATINATLTAVSQEIDALEAKDANLQTQINGKAPTVHTHTIAQVEGLQEALDAAGTDADIAAIQAQIDALNTSIAGKVAKAGDTMTGNLSVVLATGDAELLVKSNDPSGSDADARLVLDAGNGGEAEVEHRFKGSTRAFTQWREAEGQYRVDVLVGDYDVWTGGSSSWRVDDAGDGYLFGKISAGSADITGATVLRGAVTMSSTGAVKVPTGTTAQRPTGAAGLFRFNATTGKFEGHTGTAWGTIGGSFAVGDTPPSNPSNGDPWWNSADGRLYVFFVDANSSQWVEVVPGGGATIPAGTINQFAGAAAPAGWLLCDGAAVSRASYPSLFAVIGTTYGAGNGSTTFNLPNLADRVPLGTGGSKPLGFAGGAASATPTGSVQNTTLTATQMPSHKHTPIWGDGNGFTLNAGGATVPYRFPFTIDGGAGLIETTLTGGSGAHAHGLAMNAMSVEQPYLALNFIIKA